MINRKKIVYDAIVEHDQIGINKLEKILKKDPKTHMAKNTMLKLINELESDGKIKKIQKNAQAMKLTARVDKVKLEQKTVRELKRLLDECDDKLLRLRHIVSDAIYPDIVIVSTRFTKMMLLLDWKFYTASRKYEDVRLNLLIERFESLKSNLYELIDDMKFFDDLAVEEIDDELNGLILEYLADLEMELEDPE